MSITLINPTVNVTSNATCPSLQCPKNQPLTSANVFGTFLTLQFIQLTQPYGSLLFRGASGFWWRVSPIASLVEAIIIFWQLCLTPTRRQVKKHKWQVTAASLLLLRGFSDDEDGGLMAEILRGTFMDHEQGNELLAATSDRREPASTREDERGQLDSSTIYPNPMVRRRTSQLEANVISSEPTRTQPRETRILSSAFGANTLAHREWRIDLVTWLSVTTVVLKLLVITGAVWFRIACLLMLVGWAAVQSLLILFHRREMDNESKKAAVRLAQVLNKNLNSNLWIYGYLTLHAPFLGYTSYRLTFEPFFRVGALGWFGTVLCVVPLTGLTLLAVFLIIYTIYMFFSIWANLLRGHLRETGMALLFTIGSFCLMLFTLVMSLGAETSCPELLAGNHTSFSNVKLSPHYVLETTYNSKDPLWARILEGSRFFGYVVYNSLWLLVCALIIGLLCVGTFSLYPTNSTTWSPEVSGKRISLWNFGFTLTVFALYLWCYDGHGTNNPGWTGFLG